MPPPGIGQERRRFYTPDTEMNVNGLLLGFDYGSRQIGVAVGETATANARPLCIMAAKAGQPDWQQVAVLLKEWEPDYLVVGLPLNMDDTESDMAQAARKFAGRLHGRFGCRVEMHDERLSSSEARSLLRDNTASRGSRLEHKGQSTGKRVAHNKIDALAAT